MDVTIAVERLREKLIDLSANNRLLNFKHGSGVSGTQSTLRLIDELPDNLWSRLLDGKRMTFDPVPEPGVTELEQYHRATQDALPGLAAPDARANVRPKNPAVWAQHIWSDGERSLDYNLPLALAGEDLPGFLTDGRIQTLLYPDQMDARLRRLRANANLAIQESGSNMLFLALGFLEWTDRPRAGEDARKYLAPLLLLPVEVVSETTGRGTRRYMLAATGEEPQTNLSLRRKLQIDFDLSLPDLKPDQAPEEYFDAVRRAVNGQPGWRVRRFATLALLTNLGKLLMYLDLDPAQWPEASPPGRHEIVEALLGGGGGLTEDGADHEHDPAFYSAADAEAFDLDLCLVDKADPSQGKALQRALGGENLVIQGPPGTGKSQTITNLIAASLHQGKTVLFVAEKLAALQVVHRRLHEAELSDFCLELHSHKTRKKDFFENVAARLQRKARAEPAEAERTRQELRKRRDELNAYAAAVRRPAGDTGLTVSDLLFEAGKVALEHPDAARLVADLELDETVREAGPPLALDSVTRDAVADGLAEAVARLALVGVEGGLEDHPWAGVGAGAAIVDDPGRVRRRLEAWRQAALDAPSPPDVIEPSPEDARTIDAARSGLRLDRDWVALFKLFQVGEAQAVALASVMGRPMDPSCTVLATAADIARLAAEAPELAPGGDGLDRSEARETLARLADAQTRHRELSARLAGKVAVASADASGLRTAAQILITTPWWGRLSGRWRGARELAATIVSPTIRASSAQADVLMSQADQVDISAGLDLDEGARLIAGDDWRGLDTPAEGLLATADWRAEVHRVLAGPTRRPARQALLAMNRVDLRDVAAFDGGDLTRAAEAGTDMGVVEGARPWLATCVVLAAPWRARMEQAASAEDVGETLAVMAALVDAADREAAERDRIRTVFEAADKVAREASATAREAMACDLDLDDHDVSWPGHDAAPDVVVARCDAALAALDRLPAWMDFARARDQVTDEGADAVLAEVESGRLPVDQAVACWRIAWTRAAVAVLRKADPGLWRWDGGGVAKVRRLYADLDEQVTLNNRARVIAALMKRKPPLGRKSQYVKQLTELCLLQHATGLKTKHPALRDTLDRAGQALQALKPCFMMGPLSVAQYMKPGVLKFDLVVIDEASQLTPEDALGAVARGGQIVVVGDEKQLPPTSFFARVGAAADGEDDEEGPIVGQDSQSILSVASGAFGGRASPMLEWHYRSRHPELIAFSNHWFYRDRLKVMPAPSDATDALGLSLVRVTDGWARNGLNDVEARRVAEAAVAHLKARPDRSLGVVAMNLKQAERIDDWVRRLTAEDAQAALALGRDEDDARRLEPFFVKNLENVQGDERDVIMVSMTYGPPEPGGLTPLSFGPIAQDGGQRRLNVLFSRAKHRMVVFSSMSADDVRAGPESPEGTRAMRDFLRFAETKQLPSGERLTGRPPESPFEESVAAVLTDAGYALEPQFGVQGFRIDIAVRDPDEPKAFLLGVECDGAAYHSSRSARDRDRLRQEVLETMGWEIERIWSIDWFRDPRKEVDRVLARLETIRRQRARKRPAPADDQIGAIPPAAELEAGDSSAPSAVEAHGHPPPKLVQPSRRILITDDERRQRLVDLRDRIEAEMPGGDPMKALLRPRMIELLIRHKPTDEAEWAENLPPTMREETDGRQFRTYRDRVFDILA